MAVMQRRWLTYRETGLPRWLLTHCIKKRTLALSRRKLKSRPIPGNRRGRLLYFRPYIERLQTLKVEGDRLDMEGLRWPCARVAAEEYGLSGDSLRLWFSTFCTHLGRKLRSMLRIGSAQDGRYSPIRFFHPGDLAEIRSRLNGELPPRWAAAGYATVKEITARYGFKKARIRGWMKQCEPLGGALRPAKGCKKPQRFAITDLDAIQNYLVEASRRIRDEKLITSDAAAEALQVELCTLREWHIRRPHLGGRPLTVVGLQGPKDRMARNYYCRDEIREARSSRLTSLKHNASRSRHTIQFEDGIYISSVRANELFGIAAPTLTGLRSKSSWVLDGRQASTDPAPNVSRIVRHRMIEREAGGRGQAAIWYYHLEDLRLHVSRRPLPPAGNADGGDAQQILRLDKLSVVAEHLEVGHAHSVVVGTAANAELLPGPADQKAAMIAAEPGEDTEEDAPGKIPPDRRTVPMNLRQAALFMGYGKSREAQKRLRAAMDAGAVHHEMMTRQQYFFDRNDFPTENWGQVVPSRPKSS